MKSLLLVCEWDSQRQLTSLLKAQAARHGIQITVTHRESRREANEEIHYNRQRYDGVVCGIQIREQLWDSAEESSAKGLYAVLTAMGIPCWLIESEKSIASAIRGLIPLRDGEYSGTVVDLLWRDGANIVPLTGEGIPGLRFDDDRLVVNGTVLVKTRTDGKRQIIATTSFGHTFHANHSVVAQVAVRHH